MPKFRLAFQGSAGFAAARPFRHRLSWRSPWRVYGFRQMGITAARLDLLLLGLDINAVEAGSIKSEDLGFRLHRQNRTGLLGDIGRNLERHELVDQPFRRPDGVVTTVQDLVRPNPEQKFRNDMREIAWARMDEGQRHRETGIDIGFLGRDPAEIVKARQAAMLDDEVQILKRRSHVVDVGHIERIAVKRKYGRSLVDMDILDTKLLRRLEIFVRRLVAQLIALGFATPFRRVEFDALELVLFRQGMQIFQALGTVARIEGAVQNEAIRMVLLHCRITLGRVEAVLVEIG